MQSFPSHWLAYLCQAVYNVPKCWSTEAVAQAHQQKVDENLYSSLLHSQQATFFLKRGIVKNDVETKKEKQL